MRAYNFFRHRDEQHLICAVPEDGAIPGFITDKSWQLAHKVADPAAAPIGFDKRAATQGMRLNGFYLFQNFSE